MARYADTDAQRYTTLALCALLHGFTHAYLTMLQPLFLAIQKAFGLPQVAGATLLVTVQATAYFGVSLPLGVLADRSSRKQILAAGLLLNGLAFVALSQAPTYAMALGAVACAGIAGGCYHPSASALIVGLSPQRPGRFIGIAGMGAALGFFWGPFFGGWRGELAGWRAPCLDMGIAGMVVAVIFFLLARDARPAADTTAAAVDQPVRQGKTSMLVLALVCVSAAFTLRDFGSVGVATTTAVFLQKAHHYGEATTGLLLGLMSLSALIANPLIGSLSDGRHRLHWIGGLLIVAAMAAASIPLYPRSMVLVGLVIYQFCLLASYPVSEAALAESVPDRVRGRAFGIFLTISGMVAGFGPWAVGKMIDHLGAAAMAPLGYTSIYGLLAVLISGAVAGIPALLWLRRFYPASADAGIGYTLQQHE